MAMRIDDCPVKTALDVIGGKWKPLILFALKDQTLRFEQLRRSVPGCTQKVLTEQLRQLMSCEIVDRAEMPGTQPHTEYRLSAYGQTLRPALAALAEWGACHRKRVRQEP
jgi:DNA-binding HxlR family transcriptional regulator